MGHPDAHRQQTGDALRDLPSLLWPPECPPESRKGIRLSPQTGLDLDIEPVVQALGGREGGRERFVTGVLMELCTDPEVITYRADVITNLLDDPGLRERLDALFPQLSSLVRERQRPIFGYQWNVEEIVRRLGELELYVDVAVRLAEALEGSRLHALALQALHEAIHALVHAAEFVSLREELPSLRARLDGVQSITIGVNLSRDLRPESATIMSVDTERVEGRSGLLERLLGHDAALRGITKLRGGSGVSLRSFFPPMEADAFGRDNPLVEDLRRLLERVVAPVGEAIERYLWMHTRTFATLESELSFMLNGVALIERLRGTGLPVCRSKLAPMDDRTSHLEEGYNVSLALRMLHEAARGGRRPAAMVTNPITFDREQGRVWILTGPNRGGKTTYARTVGLAHLLSQAGLPVPARTARLSPVDAVYTHFPGVESTTPGVGRLDDEAVRLAEIFREATPHSLILLNEVLSGTSTLEALALAYDAVRGLCLLGARAIYVTHLHELAKHVDEINATTCGDGTVGSLVAEVEDTGAPGTVGHRRTFRIRARAPLGISYASEIAEQHGISYAQLVQLLRERGVLVADVEATRR